MDTLGGMSSGWAGHIEGYLRHLAAGGQRRATIDQRRAQLYRLARDLRAASPAALTRDHLEAWLAAREWAPSTRRGHVEALRGFYRWSVSTGAVEASPVEGLPTVRPPRPNPRPVPETAYRFALQVADDRDRLIVRLAGELGMRRSEVAQARREDVIEDLLGWSLIVRGKGGKERTLPLKDDLARELLARPAGYLLPGQIDGHLSPAYVAKRAKRLLPEGYTMHKLRHRFGSKAYAVSGDLAAVQDLLGHESPATTRIYVRVPDKAKRAIVDQV